MTQTVTSIAPYLLVIAVLCVVIMIMAFDNVKEKFIAFLGLDARYVKKENCQAHRQDLRIAIDSGRQQILDKLDAQNKILSEMKVSHTLFMKQIEHKLEIGE